MTVTKTQKKEARRFGKADMISDIEKIDVFTGRDNFEREDSECGNQAEGLKTLA